MAVTVSLTTTNVCLKKPSVLSLSLPSGTMDIVKVQYYYIGQKNEKNDKNGKMKGRREGGLEGRRE